MLFYTHHINDINQTAVLKEALRLSIGIVTPMERVVGLQGATIAGVYVPKGVCGLSNKYFTGMV